MLKKISFLFLFGITIVIGLCSADFNEEWHKNLADAIKLAANSQSQNIVKSYKYQLVDSYCNLALSADNDGNFEYKSGNMETEMGIYRKSRDSLFVRMLCTSRGALPDESLKDNTFYTKSIYYPTQKDGFAKDVCRKSGNEPQSNECNISLYANKIFRLLLDDLFSIQRAKGLNIKSTDFNDNDARILDFFDRYYLMTDKTVEELKKEYPQTIKMLDKDQKTQQSYLKKLSVLNNQNIYELGKECGSNDSNDLTLYICGIHGSGDKEGVNPYFINIITNEYINYRLFSDYYSRGLEVLSNNSKDDEVQQAYYMEIQSLKDNINQMKNAIQIARHEVNTATNAYPVHIGLAMYQEKAVKLRNNASKLLQPFYALAEKLRNVQPLR